MYSEIPKALKEKIAVEAELDRFFSGVTKYHTFALVQTRGVGKTSTIYSIASKYYVNLFTFDRTDNGFVDPTVAEYIKAIEQIGMYHHDPKQFNKEAQDAAVAEETAKLEFAAMLCLKAWLELGFGKQFSTIGYFRFMNSREGIIIRYQVYQKCKQLRGTEDALRLFANTLRQRCVFAFDEMGTLLQDPHRGKFYVGEKKKTEESNYLPTFAMVSKFVPTRTRMIVTGIVNV